MRQQVGRFGALSHHPTESSSDTGQVAEGEVAYLNAGFQKLVDPEGLPASKPPWGRPVAAPI